MQKRRIIRRLGKIANFIREWDTVPFERVAYECEIAPSTLHGYVKMISMLYPDIKYADGHFRIDPDVVIMKESE